jgi:lipid-binding SYLF domain-containing protein
MLILMVVMAATSALADTAEEIQRDAEMALQELYASSPEAKKLSTKAKGILVFPRIIKGGLIVGGHYGEGALFIGGQCRGFYNSVAATYGMQIGGQTFGFAMFMMTEDSLAYIDKAEGLEVGLGPSIVVLDKGAASSMTTTTGKDDVYAIFFDQEGLMAGMGLQGAKISRIEPE